MKRKTKRFSALLLAAAMAFGLSMSAFAETATPETAVAVQAAQAESAPAAQSEVENPAADFMITSWDDQGNTTMGERIHCATVQEAIDLAVEAGKTADTSHSMPNIYLMRDVTESITIPQSEWQLWLDLNTHSLTADNGPAITLQTNAQLGIRSWQGQTVVAGGSNSAIVCGDNSTLMITGGIFTSDTDIIQEGKICNFWITGGNFSKKLPDSMIAQGYEQVERAGMYTVRQATEAIARVEGKPQWTEYTSVQEAINAAIAEANTDGYRSVRLMNNVTASITLEGLTGNLDIDLDGWTLTAEDGKPAITAGAISGEGRVFIKDSAGSGKVNGGKSSAVLVKETNANNSANINITGGNFTSDAAPVLVVNGKAYITGGDFVGAAGQPVVQYGTDEAYSGNNSPNGCVKLAGGTWHAAADGCLLAVQPRTGSTGYAWCDVIEGQDWNTTTVPTCYGELGSTDVVNNGVGIMAGYFDRKVPENCLARGYAQVQENGLWKVFRDHSLDVAAVVSDGVNVTWASVSDAASYAAWQAAQNLNKSYTVMLLKDVTESVRVPSGGSTFTLDLNGHVLTEESGRGYAIYYNAQTGYIQDSSADKTGAIYGTVDFANTKDALNFIRGGNFHATTGPAIITAGGVTVSGGSFYGAANQPVLDTHEGSKTPGYCFMGGSEIRAGEGGKIFDGFDGLTEWNFILTNYCSSENTKFYGDLGISAARIEGGYFDRQVPANLLEEGYTQRQENGMWRVIRDTSNDAATVTGADGTNDSVDTLGNALRHAAQLSAENNATYTVTLKRDVTENAIASWYTDDANARKSKIELDLNGHTLTAKSADAAALSASNVEIFLRGNEGMINGRVESDSYLWIIHTTVNAMEGQPAIANLSKDNDSLSIKGTSVINGAAGQAAIVSNGKTTIGDGSKVVAGKGGVLFQKGEAPAEVCFVLDYCTLYGDLGDADTLDTIQVNASNGKSFTKFDREPSLKVPGYVTAKGSDGLYTYVTAPVNAMVGSKEFQTLQDAIDYAAANGGTPKMIKSLTEDITTAGTMTIDMNGCTLTGNVTANGTLTLKNGSVNGKIALGSGAALNFTNYNGLDNATLPDGYTLSAVMNADGYYSVVPYDKKLHETVKNAVEKVNAYLAGIDSSYKLETLTDDQINALAGKAFGDDSNPINAQYNAIKALNQDALQNHLNETRIGAAYSEAVSTLVNRLYSAANMEVKSANQQVEATVDTTKTELPKTEEKIPEDKQPTKQDAADKAEALKNELTGDNAAVKDFKDNNLTNTVKVKKLPNVQDDSKVELYVQAQLQDIKLGAAVKKDADGSVTEVKLNSQTLVFDVTPMAKVDDHDAVEVANDLLNGGSVVFRLPIPAEVTEKYAKVAHAGDADRYVEIKTEGGKKYIELSATHFSVFTVSFTNELPKPVQPAKPAAPAQSNDSTASSQPATTMTAPKQDDSAYYTCKACGYHNWTAVDGGYKCDHCGYVESVKQLAGYPNVKGTATVGKTAAAAKTSGKTMTAIPQTSDDMPVTALAVLAVAALLGLGVTAIAKRKHSK